MYFLLNMGIFQPAMLVCRRVTILVPPGDSFCHSDRQCQRARFLWAHNEGWPLVTRQADLWSVSTNWKRTNDVMGKRTGWMKLYLLLKLRWFFLIILLCYVSFWGCRFWPQHGSRLPKTFLKWEHAEFCLSCFEVFGEPPKKTHANSCRRFFFCIEKIVSPDGKR